MVNGEIFKITGLGKLDDDVSEQKIINETIDTFEENGHTFIKLIKFEDKLEFQFRFNETLSGEGSWFTNRS